MLWTYAQHKKTKFITTKYKNVSNSPTKTDIYIAANSKVSTRSHSEQRNEIDRARAGKVALK